MVSDDGGTEYLHFYKVSIRFEVRGGFRPYLIAGTIIGMGVSIRFEVRGGFRHGDGTRHNPQCDTFQSALRFAVVSDYTIRVHHDSDPVSIRFEVRGGFRRGMGNHMR